MSDTLTKPIVEHLSFDIDAVALKAAAAEGKREIEGLAVPYGVEIDRNNWMLGTKKLRIEDGSIEFTDDAKLFYNHDVTPSSTPLGRVIESAHTPEGKRARASFSKTPKADEVYTLCQDGTLSKFSIGFTILAYSVENADTDAPVLVVTQGLAHELSVVPYPAYDGAAVEDVLSDPNKGNRMTVKTPEREALTQDEAAKFEGIIDALSGKVEQLGAQIATLGSGQGGETFEVPFASFGEYVKALAAGDTDARELALAYEGGTIGDQGGIVKDGWLGDITRWVDKPRTVMNLFTKGAMPAEGMGVEFAFLDEDSTSITEQLEEGDTLAYGNVKFDTDSAPIKTYGGYGEASFQAVERSPINIIDTLFTAFAIRYAKVTETVVRGAAVNATGVKEIGTGGVAGLDDADAWIDFTIDAAAHFDDKGMPLEFILASTDVYKNLAKLRDGNATDAPRLLNRNSGQIDIPGLKGDMFGIPVIRVAGTGVVRACNSFAIKSFENAGAPLRLGPEKDITKLTNALGVYGYLAVALQDAQAIVKPGA